MQSMPVPLEIVSGAEDEVSEKKSLTGGCAVAQSVRETLADLTGMERGRVSGLCREEDGWHVTVDMVELKRIPASTDVLGAYEALADDRGNLITYKRIRRYCRGEATTTL